MNVVFFSEGFCFHHSLIQVWQECAPHLGRLATKAERTFVQLILNDKEETLKVAQMVTHATYTSTHD